MGNRLFRRSFVLGLSGALALALVASAQASDDPGSSGAVVMSLMEAMRLNDAEGIRAAFAETASQAYGDGRPKTGAEFAGWLQSDIIDVHGRVEGPQIAITDDGVVVTGEYRNSAGYRSPANFLFRVEGDRIVSWQMRY